MPYIRKVHYYETDKMGIVHHSNYIRIFEEARIDFLNKIGKPFEEIESLGLLTPILSVNCKYKMPLKFDDEFAVYMRFTRFTGVILDTEYKIENTSTGNIHATGTTMQCFTDSELTPIRIKRNFPEIYKIFKQHENVWI